MVLLNKKGEGEVLEMFGGVMHHIVLECSHPLPSPTHPRLGSVIVKTFSRSEAVKCPFEIRFRTVIHLLPHNGQPSVNSNMNPDMNQAISC